MSSLAFNGPKRGKVSAARLIDRPMCLAVRSFIHSFIHSVLLPPLHWIRQRPFTIVARGQKENRSQATERKKKTKESKNVCCGAQTRSGGASHVRSAGRWRISMSVGIEFKPGRWISGLLCLVFSAAWGADHGLGYCGRPRIHTSAYYFD